MSSALDRDTDRVEEALDELRRAAGHDPHRGSILAERRGVETSAEEETEEDPGREPVNPSPDIPIEYAEEIPFQHFGGPASYWSTPRPRSWIGIMMRFVGVAAVLPADVVKARFWYERAEQLGCSRSIRRCFPSWKQHPDLRCSAFFNIRRDIGGKVITESASEH
jgi:hypothetical protein